MRDVCHRPRAFTLLELLVVVGIIAVLISLLLPVLNSARDAAHTVKCLSNMRQVGMFIRMYANDNDGVYPVDCYTQAPVPTYTWYISWDDRLSRYDGRHLSQAEMEADHLWESSSRSQINALYRCPAETYYDKNFPDLLYRSYTMPRAWSGGAAKGVFWPASSAGPYPSFGRPVRVASIHAPASTILLCELRQSFPRLGSDLGEAIDGPIGHAGQCNPPDMPIHLKNSRWNYAFCDGHAETLFPNDTAALDGSGNPISATRMWTIDPTD